MKAEKQGQGIKEEQISKRWIDSISRLASGVILCVCVFDMCKSNNYTQLLGCDESASRCAGIQMRQKIPATLITANSL